MNKMLVVVFDNEGAADAGGQALRQLHGEGEITLYATAVYTRDAAGTVSFEQAIDRGASRAGVGLAVGALVGLMSGPLGLAVGAATGTVAGAIRDFWVAGVDLDFVEESGKMITPGKVALVAEVDEEWVVPVDSALEACGGSVYRRARSEVVDTQFDQSIAAFKAEIEELEAEAAHANSAARTRLQAQLAAAQAGLARAVQLAKQRVETLAREAEGKALAIKRQLRQAKGEVKGTLEDRIQRMRHAYHARGARLSQAWSLTRPALTV